MAEVDDPDLRKTVLRLCLLVVDADDHVATGESIAIRAAIDEWDAERPPLRAPARSEAAAA